jgi:hypothetical protein
VDLFDILLLRIRIPVPWPLIVGLLVMGFVFAPSRFLEWEGRAEAGCFFFALLAGISVAWLLYRAGHPIWY